MPTRPGASRPLRRLAFFGRHFSFANLTALLALFVALGGSSYAALSVGSKQIANNSVRSKDLRNNNVRGRDIHKATVRGTDVRDGDLKGRDVRDDTLTGADVKESSLATVPSAQDAQTLTGKPASAFLGSDKQLRTGLIKLLHGDTKTVASSGPFTWKAACTDDGGGNTGLTVTLESTEANSFAGDFGGGGTLPVSPGSPATVFTASDSGPHYTIGFPLSAVAPSGAAPVGLGFVGLNAAGADCVVNGILWP
jgi:hypothetical protein